MTRRPASTSHRDVDARIEELPHRCRLHADLTREELHARRHGGRLQTTIVARDHFVGRKTIVEQRLEHLHALARDHRAPQTTDQLLRFSGEHASGDDFDPAAVMLIQGIPSSESC
jgi:hypothetical protein